MRFCKRVFAVIVTVAMMCVPGSAQKRDKQPPPAPKIAAQELVTKFLAAHSDALEAVEMALTSGRGCKTVAATHTEDIGEACDADERAAMKSGQPYIEPPTKADPIYDITQALHDGTGALIGAVGMDLKPSIGDRATVVARARALLRELEAQIPSAAKLLEPTTR
jgi:hypothetical protein